MYRNSLLCLVLLALGMVACNQDSSPPAAVRTVLVHTVAPVSAQDEMVLAGEVRARHEADLAFRVGGKLLTRRVDAGATVKAGDELARLDPVDLRLATQSARAQLAAAESDAATTKADRLRYAGLLERKFISQAAFDARDNLAKAAAARLEQARAQNAATGNQLAYGTLLADRPGVITGAFAEAGQVVAAGQPIVRLALPDEKEVVIAVPESRVAALKVAQSFRISLWAAPQLQLTGELRELSPAADALTRTYAARVRIIKPPPEVQLGMTARVHAASRAPENAPIVVPAAAIVDQGQGPSVWLVVNNTVRRQPVVIKQFREDGVVLASGLRGGEHIVAAGAHRLAEGQVVRPLATAESGR